MTLSILFSIAAAITAKSAYDRADQANNRAEDMRETANAKLDEARGRYDELASKFAIVERENRVTQERWNDLKVELAKRGISTSDH